MLTSLDIRHAYARIHGLSSIDELVKFDMLNAGAFPPEDLGLPIDEFMVKHGFIAAYTKLIPTEIVCYPEDNQEVKVKRAYNKRVK